MEYNSFNGTYSPSLYKIYVGTGNSFASILDLPSDVQATYFHEYFHYLQDLTSVFGTTQAWNFYDRTRQLIRFVQKFPGSDLELPLATIPELQHIVEHEKVSLEVCGDWNVKYGLLSSQADSVDIAKISSERRPFTSKTNSTIEYPKLKVQIKENGITADYFLGAISIIESMTALIQRKFYGPKNYRDLPYSGVQKVVEFQYPDQAISEEALFSLCDVSLLSPYPSVTLFNIMDHFQVFPMDGDVIYDVGLEVVHDKWPLWAFYDDQKNGLLQVVSELYNHEVFINDLAWFIHVITNGFRIRVEDPRFMLKLYREGNIFDNEIMSTLKYYLGAPEIINLNNERWFSAPWALKQQEGSINTVFLAIYQKLHDFLLHGKVKDWLPMEEQYHCRMKNHCIGSTVKMPVDEDCINAPWKKAEERYLCPFGAIYKLNGMADKKFKFL